MVTATLRLFPGGRTKALTLSYEDGQVHDRRLVDIFSPSTQPVSMLANGHPLEVAPGETVRVGIGGRLNQCFPWTSPRRKPVGETPTVRRKTREK